MILKKLKKYRNKKREKQGSQIFKPSHIKNPFCMLELLLAKVKHTSGSRVETGG